MAEKTETSTYASGGGGTSFEHRIAAVALSSLLLDSAFPGLGDEYAVREVGFQASGESVDDVRIVGYSPKGAARTIVVACRHKPTLLETDEKTTKLFKSFVADHSKNRSDFEAGNRRMGLAYAATGHPFEQLDRICELANSNANDRSFREALAREGGDTRSRFTRLEAMMAKFETDPAPEVPWAVLRNLRPLLFRVEGTAENVTETIARLRSVTSDPTGLWMRLCELARTSSAGGTFSEQSLRRALSGFDLSESPRFERSVGELTDQSLRNLQNGNYTLGQNGLRLPRHSERRRLLAVLHQTISRSPCVVSVTGDPDVGKSQLAREVATELQSKSAVVFFDLRSLPEVPEIFETLLGCSLRTALVSMQQRTERFVFVDSAEASLEHADRMFAYLIGEAVAAGFTPVVVARSDARMHLESKVRRLVEASEFVNHLVSPLAEEDVLEILRTFPTLNPVGTWPSGKWLLSRPGLVRWVLESLEHGGALPTTAAESDILHALWQGVIRRQSASQEGLTAKRNKVMLQLGEAFIRNAVPKLDDTLDAAVESLRLDGVVAPPAMPWATSVNLASDLWRDLAGAVWLSGQSTIPDAIPRQALRSARISSQIRLASGDSVRELFDSYDHLAERVGARWNAIPIEAMIALGSRFTWSDDIWTLLSVDHFKNLNRVLKSTVERFDPNVAYSAPELLSPLIECLLHHEAQLRSSPKTTQKLIIEVGRLWLSGMALRCATSHETRQKVCGFLLANPPAGGVILKCVGFQMSRCAVPTCRRQLRNFYFFVFWPHPTNCKKQSSCRPVRSPFQGAI
jgi:hypothetical protein